MDTNPLFIGFDRSPNGEEPEPIELGQHTLLRHFMALGSSGSGKTVLSKILVEEISANGIPVICIDPQGDLCSLALAADDPDKLVEKGLDPELARAFSERIDAVVFTPASQKGVAVSADPIRIDPHGLDERERLHAFSATATMLTSLLGYDLDSDEGEGLVAVFDRALLYWFEQGCFPHNLDAFTQLWHSLDEEERGLFSRYLDEKKINQAGRKLARLDVGARRLLFHEGTPLDMDRLLGLDESAIEGKTRISIIYLNSLHSQEDKEYFVAALTRQLYGWMLDHPSKTPQALFYIDEVAPFIPPVRKPACKDVLMLLFKQARKYGVCCLMATQNPADVDYKAMAQFGTWALGRLTTRQDLNKIQQTVKSLDPVNSDQVMSALPAQKPGEFLLISPDNFDTTRTLQARWLYSKHETLDEDAIARLADERGWRQRFLDGRIDPEPEPDEPLIEEPEMEPEPELADDDRAPEEDAGQGEVVLEEALPAAGSTALPDSEPIDSRDALLQQQARILAKGVSMTANDFARRLKVSDSSARNTLKRLVNAGLAEQFKQGRSMHYWARVTGLRPDLGLYDQVTAIQPLLNRFAAEGIAHNLKDGKTLGLLGSAEELQDMRLQYQLMIRVRFHEKVKQPIWRRLLSGREFEERAESIYFHPRNLKVVVFDPREGVSLYDRPAEIASAVRDFDGAVQFEKVGPANIPLDEHEWLERADDRRVLKTFANLYDAKALGLDAVFLPIWRVFLHRPGKPGARIVTIDALSGFPMEW